MKKILLSIIGFGTIVSLSAQNWVSTTPENRKVVLEELTGVRCTFCPDGHKIANQLKAANAGKVALINIHAGGFAAPGPDDLDLRTAEGTSVDAASGVTGYPSGIVNRNKTPWVSGRNLWANETSSILGQASPVNIYVKSTVDYQTRELTTEVEIYYTANGSANNRLSIVLTQDEILGNQTGGTTYYPENFYDGKYIHSHVFRRFLTSNGINGETLDSTSIGDYIYRKIITPLPAKIGTIDLNINKLNVVAFITENRINKVLTGAEASVQNSDPNLTDLSIVNKTVAALDLCAGLSPILEVTNNSTKTLTQFELTIKNGATTYTKAFTGSLAPNAKTNVTFDPISGFTGEYALSPGISSIENGTLTDIKAINNGTSISGIGFTKNAYTYRKFSFNNGIMNVHTGRQFLENTQFIPVFSNTTPVGQSSNGAIRFSLHSSWNVAGKPGSIVLGEANFANTVDPMMSYYYAYSDGAQNGTAPKFEVSVSENCGGSWTAVSTVTCVSTGEPAVVGNFYIPTSNQYRQVKIDLAAYKNKSVLIKIAGIPGTTGNALYLDEVEIGSTNKITKVAVLNSLELNVYPSPASNLLNIVSSNNNVGSVKIINLEGKTVLNNTISNGVANVDVSSLTSGVYMVEVIINGTKEIQKVTKL